MVHVASWNCCNASPKESTSWAAEIKCSTEADVVLLQESSEMLGAAAALDADGVLSEQCDFAVFHTPPMRVAVIANMHVASEFDWWSGEAPQLQVLSSLTCACAVVHQEVAYASSYLADSMKRETASMMHIYRKSRIHVTI